MAFIRINRERNMYYGAKEEAMRFSHNLKKTMTKAEMDLWWKLRNKNLLGTKFRRQHAIAHFIADFYSHELRLVIEIDGPRHHQSDQKEYDRNRDAEFNRLGINVLRFSNDEIFDRMDEVINSIKNEISRLRQQNLA
jgi:very-short-patch-repair endonuclease